MDEKNLLKSKLHIKSTQLEEKQREYQEREREVRQLRERINQLSQKQAAQQVPGAEEVQNNAWKYNDEDM